MESYGMDKIDKGNLITIKREANTVKGQKVMKIKNAPDTGGLKPQDYTDYSSWIDYWKSKKDGFRDLLRPKYEIYKYRCSKCGRLFTWGEFNGAHVEKVNSTDEKLYIYPLCEHCNKERNEDPFEGNVSLLLEMPQKKK